MENNISQLKTIEHRIHPPLNQLGHPSVPTRKELVAALSYFLEALERMPITEDHANNEIRRKVQDLYNKACDSQPTGTAQFLNELDLVYRLLEKHHLFKSIQSNNDENIKPKNTNRI